MAFFVWSHIKKKISKTFITGICNKESNTSLEQAINRTFSSDEKEREEGRDELRTLRKNDPLASDYFTADSLETEFYKKGDIEAARKAIEIFERLLRRGSFDFLKARIERLKRNAGLSQ